MTSFGENLSFLLKKSLILRIESCLHDNLVDLTWFEKNFAHTMQLIFSYISSSIEIFQEQIFWEILLFCEKITDFENLLSDILKIIWTSGKMTHTTFFLYNQFLYGNPSINSFGITWVFLGLNIQFENLIDWFFVSCFTSGGEYYMHKSGWECIHSYITNQTEMGVMLGKLMQWLLTVVSQHFAHYALSLTRLSIL